MQNIEIFLSGRANVIPSGEKDEVADYCFDEFQHHLHVLTKSKMLHIYKYNPVYPS